MLDAYVVPSAVPFHSIMDAETKPVPEAVTVSAAPPAEAEFGFNPLSVGTGFCDAEEPPPHALKPSAQERRTGTRKT